MQKKIAIVFDFDDTLAHDTTTSLLLGKGIDVKAFWGPQNQALLDNGWDPVPAYMHQILEWSHAQAPEHRITKATLEEAGKAIQFFPGVPRLFPYLREFVQSKAPAFTVDFFVISSGLGDLLRRTQIAGYFTEIFASDFAYYDDGEVAFPKKIVSFTDKTRYLFQITKGIFGKEFVNKPFEVNKKIKDSDRFIPLENMIYIGDGFTDIPCFSLMNKNNGHAIAVYDKHNQDKKIKSWGFIEDGRVRNLHSADYTKDSDLVNTIEMAIGSIIYKANNSYRG